MEPEEFTVKQKPARKDMTVRNRIPYWVKILYLAWLFILLPSYWVFHGPQNLLWLCDAANIVLLFALWRESALLMSSQACGVVLVQLVWTVDLLCRLLFGFHLVGGTEYMFDTSVPLWLRSISLFHVFMPLLLLWGLNRLGYDRRGWKLETLFAWLLLPLTFLLTDPELNINWLWQPFGVPQTFLPPSLFLLVMMLLYPLVIFYPSHRVLQSVFRSH
jgi:hypothetical protein